MAVTPKTTSTQRSFFIKVHTSELVGLPPVGAGRSQSGTP